MSSQHETSNRESIEAAIDEDPEELGNYAVLADWLQANEPQDPRGELIPLMLAFEAEPSERLRREIEMVFARHTNALLGSLTRFMRGFDQPPLVWRGGFIHALDIFDDEIDNIVKTTLTHPSGRFVTTLALKSGRRDALIKAINTVAARVRNVRVLSLLTSHQLGAIDALFAALPRLEHVSIDAGVWFANLALPHVEYATFRVPFMPRTVEAIASAELSKLRQLNLDLLGDVQFDPLAPLFTRALPELRYLALRNLGEIKPALLGALIAAPWLEQLHALDLTGIDLRDEDAALLAQNAPRFRSNLKLLVESTKLTSKGIKALRVIDPRYQR